MRESSALPKNETFGYFSNRGNDLAARAHRRRVARSELRDVRLPQSRKLSTTTSRPTTQSPAYAARVANVRPAMIGDKYANDSFWGNGRQSRIVMGRQKRRSSPQRLCIARKHRRMATHLIYVPEAQLSEEKTLRMSMRSDRKPGRLPDRR